MIDLNSHAIKHTSGSLVFLNAEVLRLRELVSHPKSWLGARAHLTIHAAKSAKNTGKTDLF
jgi:hypothetical protein